MIYLPWSGRSFCFVGRVLMKIKRKSKHQTMCKSPWYYQMASKSQLASLPRERDITMGKITEKKIQKSMSNNHWLIDWLQWKDIEPSHPPNTP